MSKSELSVINELLGQWWAVNHQALLSSEDPRTRRAAEQIEESMQLLFAASINLNLLKIRQRDFEPERSISKLPPLDR